MVECNREFYIQLVQLLEPDERWVKEVNGKMALLLWCYPGKQLIFMPGKK